MTSQTVIGLFVSFSDLSVPATINAYTAPKGDMIISEDLERVDGKFLGQTHRYLIYYIFLG